MSKAMDSLRSNAVRLDGNKQDYDELLEQVGERHCVLLGEASHGTREFYRMRGEITQRLIEEKGFEAVVVEADWPDALRLNRYACGISDDSLFEAFADFQRFPQWMWRNQEVRDFISWLRRYNASRDPQQQVSFHGLDIYSLYRSAEAVIGYLQSFDPKQARRAQERYSCFDHSEDPFRYGHDAAFGLSPSCEEATIVILAELANKAEYYLRQDGQRATDEQFYAEQNARVVVNAEAYYRAMFGSRVDTWNLRDEHMTDTLVELRKHLQGQGGQGKLVVWAHNSHLGDARSTEMGWHQHQHNIGQLARQRFGKEDTLLVGFTTYTGYVSAAQTWDGPVEHRWVRPALTGSYERLFHDSGLERFYLRLDNSNIEPLRERRLERAIGVIYRPETERISHYFEAILPQQFDAIFHINETNAVEPFEKGDLWRPEIIPDTYPFGV